MPHLQGRTCLSVPMGDAGRSAAGPVRIHRRLLQPAPHALGPRVSNPRASRAEHDRITQCVRQIEGRSVRRIVYTTNSIEALNSKLRRAVRARGHFPSDEAATKLLYLILNRSEKEWKMPPREWTMAKAQFAVIRSEEHTSELQSLMRTSYAVFCLQT